MKLIIACALLAGWNFGRQDWGLFVLDVLLLAFLYLQALAEER